MTAGFDPERVPVIVGGGQLNDRPVQAEEGLDSLQLMAAALQLAEQDAGGEWLAELEAIYCVDQVSWPQLGDIPTQLASQFGARPRLLETSAIAGGDQPIHLLNKAANRIGSGEARICAVVGGEGMRSATQLAKKAIAEGREPGFTKLGAKSSAAAPAWRKRYGLLLPLEIYPLLENAGRAARGQSLAEAQAESGRLWALMAAEAARSPGAWKPMQVSAETISAPSVENPLLAFPYTRLMAANPSVNQGAGVIVASLAEARRRGIPEQQLVYIGNGARAAESTDPLARDRYDWSSSLEVSLEKALAFNAVRADELDHVELYSCFPCIPKLARRVLDWPEQRPVSVFGGMTFGGGPVANYMSHGLVEMVSRLRAGGTAGLLLGNGGYATTNHSILLSSRRLESAGFPRDFDVQADADTLRRPVPERVERAEGAAEIETYTVLYEQSEPRWGVIVARTASGQRTLAKVPASDTAAIAWLTDGVEEPVGARGWIHFDAATGDQHWRRADDTSGTRG